MLKLIQHPHPTLKMKSNPVTEFNEQLKTIVSEMITVMKEEQGIGLAANQVNLTQRIFIMQANMDKNAYVFINPIITPIDQQEVQYEEGCLSFPGIIQSKNRYAKVNVKWQNEEGNFLEEDFEGLEAICVQHENDHINGITFIHHLSPLKQQFALKKMKKSNGNKLKPN